MKLQLVVLVTAVLLSLVAAGRADDKKDAPKVEAMGTLTLGEKKFTLASALVYVNPHSFGKETVVFLTEKPLDTAKLTQSFKKRGNDGDFSPNVDYIKLTFSDDNKGKLTQFAFAGGGAGIVLQGDKNIKGEATFKEGTAKGSAGTIKADKVNDKTFEFEVAFDVKLTNP